MLGAMAAIMVVATVPPALGQVSQGFSEKRDTSGTATPKVAISNTGKNANVCTALQQAAQTGQVLNEQGVVQYVSKADDLESARSRSSRQQLQDLRRRPRQARRRPRLVLPRPRQARRRPRRFRRPVALIVSHCWVLVLVRCWWPVGSSLAGSSAKA